MPDCRCKILFLTGTQKKVRNQNVNEHQSYLCAPLLLRVRAHTLVLIYATVAVCLVSSFSPANLTGSLRGRAVTLQSIVVPSGVCWEQLFPTETKTFDSATGNEYSTSFPQFDCRSNSIDVIIKNRDSLLLKTISQPVSVSAEQPYIIEFWYVCQRSHH